MANPNKKSSKIIAKRLQLSLQLYADFYPRFYLLESTLKNRLFTLLKKGLGEDWFSLQLEGSQHTVFGEEREFIGRRKPKDFVLHDKGLLVESGLGFWVEFYNRELYKATKGLPISVFENLPRQVKRKDIYVRLERIKSMRNMLVHSRIPPITSLKELKYLDPIIEAAKDLEEILLWLGGIPEKLISSKKIIEKASRLKKQIE